MNRNLKLCLALCVLLVFPACEERTEKTDGGGVILSITDFDGFPVQFSVNGGGPVTAEQIIIQNIPKNPNAPTSQLMNVEMENYEVRCTRGDAGSRTPPPFVRGLFGVVPVAGTAEYNNLPLLDQEQLGNAPLSDLLFENGGTDTETGEDSILLNCRMRFFGRTISGQEVETAWANFPAGLRATQ